MIKFVTIQTTFEGYSSNSFEKGVETLKKYNLSDLPMGQSGEKNSRSKFMKNYRTGGTPWVIIIDKNGIVRYNDFHIGVKQATELMVKLKIGE